MRRQTLVGVIYPSFLVVIIFTIIIISISATTTIRGLLFDQTTLRLKAVTRILSELIDEEAYPYGPQVRDIRTGLTSNEEMRIILYRGNEKILHSNHLIETEAIKAPTVPSTGKAFDGEAGGCIVRGEPLTLERVYYSVPIRHGDEIAGVIEASLPLTSVKTTLMASYDTLLLIIGVMLLGSIFMSYYVSVRIDLPLKKISAAARRYRDFDFTPHPRINAPREVEIVSETLRSMSISLQERIQTTMRQKQELRTILDGMVEAVILLDGNLAVREINPAVEKLFKRHYTQVVGKNLLQVVRSSELYDLVSEALHSEHSLEKTMSMPEELDPAMLSSRPSARAGRFIHLQVHASVVTEEVNEEGVTRELKRVVVVLNDITRMKNLERIRRDFVANVSHELKTPITSIKGFTETLLEGAIEDRESAHSFVSIIHAQSERLVAIIEDLLSLSRLEQQEDSSMEKENSAVAPIINGAVQICRVRAEKKWINITSHCRKDETVYGNNHLIEQALVNLIDNAVKYSPKEAKVEIICRNEAKGTYLTVHDNGPGIPQKELARIFERFYRVDKTRSRELGGTGLGLSIVKHIAIAHGGEVTVESELEAGSDFTVFFPAPGH